MRHGGQILVDQLKIQGVKRVFCVPGESYLAALDGLYESGIDVVVARQEGGAAMMAEAQGKLSGRPGVAMVTRGPGATNASSGVHVALQDSTPMILFIGQVARDQRDREAFQEVDYRQMFGPLAKWVAEIEQVERIPEYISRAFHVAVSGRPGPVVLALPEDMLSGSADTADAPPARPAEMIAAPAHAEQIAAELVEAERPFVLVGGGGWTGEASADLRAFAERFQLPVGASFRCQDYLDNRSSSYVGDVAIGVNPKLAQRVREADVLLVIGARLGEMTTSGYTLVNIPGPAQKLIHVHADPDEIGRVYRPHLGVAASSPSMLAALAGLQPPAAPGWAGRTAEARAELEAWRAPSAPEEGIGLTLEPVVRWLSENLPEDAILTNGAGNYAAWLHRYYQYKAWRTQLAPTSGSMGYGLPAAVAAKLAEPSRDVVCFAGDGCFQMTCQEFGVAAEHGAAVIVVVANNGMYGTIRMHQERHYPGRVSGTGLANPDFAAWAQAYGGHGEKVTAAEQFPAAFERAKASGKPAIIEVVTDPRKISPAKRLG